MKLLKRIGWGLLTLLVISAVALMLWIQGLKPDYEGEITMADLDAPVDVYYDAHGVPHIYAEDEKEAFRALGYVHAQDRLWQMEVLRRVASGGLSEVFGEDLINTDRFFLALDIDEASKRTLDKLDKEGGGIELCEAYLEGINQFVDEGPTPIEFYLTGIEKRPFTLKDVYNSIGYMAFSFAMAHKTDPLITNIADKMGEAYIAELGLYSSGDTEQIHNHYQNPKDSVSNGVTTLVHQALNDLSLPLFEGSNSWVIAPGKTKNGQVIFANDPHIGFAQPSVWYEAHVVTPKYEKYGYHLAGIPFPLLGHDRRLAYGMTMFENDDIDFYFEEFHPTDSTKYRDGDDWKSFQTTTKTIKVKGAPDVEFTYKKTKHGPVLNGIANQIVGERPISMAWIYTQYENTLMDALYGISHATDLQEFRAALPHIHAPGLNVMYGDAEGNVAWWASAKLYQMPDSTYVKRVLEEDKTPVRYLDFDENPQAINPPSGYVYSANNQPDSISIGLYPGYYLPENRAKRIVQLLEPKNDWDRDAVGEMINDVTSSVDPLVVKDLSKALDIKELDSVQIKILDHLNAWDGSYALESVDAVVYTRWVYFFLYNVFHDELGEEYFNQFLATHFQKRLIAPMAHRETSMWFDDISTTGKTETKQDIVSRSFNETLQSLTDDFGDNMEDWTWNKVHTLEIEHPIGNVKALRSFFNVGPYPVVGSREVINNLTFVYDGTGHYKVSSGPSTRRVIDFSDVENSMSILPTGQSGNPFSPFYRDQAPLYIKGQFRKMLLNKDTIQSSQSTLLRFMPHQ